MRILTSLFFIFICDARADFKCLNPLQDPKEISYAKKLSDIADYVEKAPDQYLKLKQRQKVIERRLQALNTIIPNLENELSPDGTGLMFRETQFSQLNLSKAQAEAEQVRETAKAQAEQERQTARTQLNTEQLQFQRMKEGSETAFRMAQDILTQRKREILSSYNDKVLKLTKQNNSKRSSQLLQRGSLSIEQRDQILSGMESFSQEREILEDEKKKKIKEIDIEMEALNERQIVANSSLENEELRLNQKEQEINQKYQASLDQADLDYENLRRTSRRAYVQRLARIKNRLQEPHKRLLQEKVNLEKEQNEILNGKPLPMRPKPPEHYRPLSEKLLEYHGLKQIEANIGRYLGNEQNGKPIFSADGRFEMIKRWWSEQGKENRQKRLATEAQTLIECKDCSKVQALPIPELSSRLKKECVVLSISTLTSDSPQYYCEDSHHTNGKRISKSCQTDELADYTQWSINNALRCISPTSPKDEIDPNIIAIKINRESNFNLAYHYEGGTGIAQTTTCARDEMMGCSPSPHCCNQRDASCRAKTCSQASSGRKFMADTLSNRFENYNKLLNPQNRSNQIESAKRNNPCIQYKKIFDHDQELENIHNNEMGERRLFDVGSENKCQSLSLEEGMHRNLLNGLGLYLFYRDHGDESATGLLQNTLGLNESNSDYKKIRDYMTLGMYGASGRTGATIIFNNLAPDLKRKMRDGKLTFEEFKETLAGPNGIDYLKQVDESAKKSYKDIGEGDPSCAY